LVNEVLADAVGDALAVDVIAGDFFGTGKSSPSDGGDMLVPHSWRVVPADVGRSPSHTVAADSGRVDV
jgi:hypothetical protein